MLWRLNEMIYEKHSDQCLEQKMLQKCKLLFSLLQVKGSASMLFKTVIISKDQYRFWRENKEIPWLENRYVWQMLRCVYVVGMWKRNYPWESGDAGIPRGSLSSASSHCGTLTVACLIPNPRFSEDRPVIGTWKKTIESPVFRMIGSFIIQMFLIPQSNW